MNLNKTAVVRVKWNDISTKPKHRPLLPCTVNYVTLIHVFMLDIHLYFQIYFE